MNILTQGIAEDELKDMADKRDFLNPQWYGGKFLAIKIADTTPKGALGEDFLAKMLSICGYDKIGVPDSRRGAYDVSLMHNGKTILFEVKVATRDTAMAFQFNGIRYDTRYTHLFCLGISPNTIGYLIIPKTDLVDPKKHRLVSMAKGSNSGFKLTKHHDTLNSFNRFSDDVSLALDKVDES